MNTDNWAQEMNTESWAFAGIGGISARLAEEQSWKWRWGSGNPKANSWIRGKKKTSHTGQRKEVGQIYDTSVQARQSPQSFFIHLMYNYLFVLVVSRSSWSLSHMRVIFILHWISLFASKLNSSSLQWSLKAQPIKEKIRNIRQARWTNSRE